MNVEIGTEAAQFYFWEYKNRIFFAVYSNNSISLKKMMDHHADAPCWNSWKKTFAPFLRQHFQATKTGVYSPFLALLKAPAQ